MDTCMTTVSYM